MKLELMNYAIASDGGSIALCFNSKDGKEFWVSLDKGIESKNKNRIFTSDKEDSPLTQEEEIQLLSILESAVCKVDGGLDLIKEICNLIKNR